METMISAYYRLEVLPDDLKAANKIKVGAKIPRYDCIKSDGIYHGIKPFINPVGMFKLSLTDCKDFVKTDVKRMGDFALIGGKNLNFSSLYSLEGTNFYYGNPNGKPILKDGRPNPVFQHRHDLYICFIPDGFKQIELFVLPHQKGYALELIQAFAEGDFDDEVTELRSKAKTFFDYGCL